MDFRLPLTVIVLAAIAGTVIAQERRPERPLFNPKCSRFSMEFDEDLNRWKCIIDKPLRQNYRRNRTEDRVGTRRRQNTRIETESGRAQQQRDRQLRAEQEQRTRQLESEQNARAEQQRRFTEELIREVQQRSRR